MQPVSDLGDAAYIKKNKSGWIEAVVVFQVSNLAGKVRYGGHNGIGNPRQKVPYSEFKPTAIGVARQVANRLK